MVLQMSFNVTGVIFAKESERFPGKHSQLVWDSTLIDLVADRAMQSKLLKSVIILSRDPEIQSDVCDVIADETVGSLVDSLCFSLEKYGDVFAIGGDMPCLDPALVDLMIQSYSGITLVPRKEDHTYEPLHAIYSPDTIDQLRMNIKEGKRSLRQLMDSVQHQIFNVPRSRDSSFRNVNYPSDLEYIKRNGCF